MQYIVRFEFGSTLGWWVRIQRSTFKHRKLFSDGVHGGKQKALIAAKAYRDQLVKKAPDKLHDWSLVLKTSGSYKRHMRLVRTRSRDVYRVDTFTAWIRTKPNVLACSRWSIEKWGVREAKRKCLQWLREKQREQRENYAQRKHKARYRIHVRTTTKR